MISQFFTDKFAIVEAPLRKGEMHRLLKFYACNAPTTPILPLPIFFLHRFLAHKIGSRQNEVAVGSSWFEAVLNFVILVLVQTPSSYSRNS